MDLNLFDPAPEGPAKQRGDGPRAQVFSVSEITRRIRGLLEDAIGDVWVEGEVSNLRKQVSGHQYFTLKDGNSQLSCVLFRGHGKFVRTPLEEGMMVQAFGELTVYEARGQYQLVVRLVQGRGQGELQARFEALKQKLDAEGLFAPDRKMPVPPFPQTIALVTSPTGAAVRDIINVLRRRAPWVRVIVSPVRVQGDGAHREIAAAIRELDAAAGSRPRGRSPGTVPAPDTIIVGRGGGSIEDLWNFNEEEVARAIADCQVPVIAAIGHEIDFTIADFVADLRAPTPSAAAELAVPDKAELAARLANAAATILHRARGSVERWRKIIELTRSGTLGREPQRVLAEHQQSLDLLASELGARARGTLADHRHALAAIASDLDRHRPDRRLAEQRGSLALLGQRLETQTRSLFSRRTERLARARSLVQTLGPGSVFARGYSMTLDSEGRPLSSVRGIAPGDRITTLLADGTIASEVEETDVPGGRR